MLLFSIDFFLETFSYFLKNIRILYTELWNRTNCLLFLFASISEAFGSVWTSRINEQSWANEVGKQVVFRLVCSTHVHTKVAKCCRCNHMWKWRHAWTSNAKVVGSKVDEGRRGELRAQLAIIRDWIPSQLKSRTVIKVVRDFDVCFVNSRILLLRGHVETKRKLIHEFSVRTRFINTARFEKYPLRLFSSKNPWFKFDLCLAMKLCACRLIAWYFPWYTARGTIIIRIMKRSLRNCTVRFERFLIPSGQLLFMIVALRMIY